MHRRATLVVLLSLLCACASSLKVTSSPPGARILIDGKDTGYTTPDTLRPRILPQGLHQIGVAHAGYETTYRAVDVSVSFSLIFWSMVFPPAFLVNVFKGFSSAEPGSLHFVMRPEALRPPPVVSAPVVPPQRARKKLREIIKCAALPLKTMELSAGLQSVVDEILLSELLQSGFDPIGREDLNALLDFDKQRSAVDCSESACIAEIGQALGVPYLVSGNVVRLEDSSVITLKLMHVQDTRVVARVNRVVPSAGEDLILGMITQAVEELAEKSGL